MTFLSDISHRARRLIGAVATLGIAATGLTACGNDSSEIVINLYNAPQQNLSQIVKRCNDLAGGAYRIKLNTLPRDADGQREQMVRRLAAADDGMDVLGTDVTWTAELAAAGWIRKWTGANKAQAEAGTLQAPLTTAQWEGDLYAAPSNSNVQLLWYRADLVPDPPETWAELIEVATKLASENKPHYVEVTGAQYEGIIVWFNSLISSAGGSILSPQGDKVELGEPAITALKTMRDFARSEAANPSLTNTQEDSARLAMESGVSAMEINWPFVYASMAASKTAFADEFKWAPYPGIDGVGKSPLGGSNFAVSSYSEHPKESFAAALCLRDPESQLISATKDGLPPTIEAVYQREEMVEPYPMRDTILQSIKNASARPVTPVYQNVSTTSAAILSPPDDINPTKVEKLLHENISDALESKGVLP